MRSMITVTYLSPRLVWRQTCSSTPMTFTPYALKPRGVVDQQPFAFSQDRVGGGVPRDPESLGDTGDGEVCDHDPFQRPPQPGARELRTWLRRGAGVLAPHVSAVGTAVAARYNCQHGRSPDQRLVGQPPDRGLSDGWRRNLRRRETSTSICGPPCPAYLHRHLRRPLKRLRRRDRRGGGRGELKEWSLLGFDAAASSGETIGTGRSSSVTTGWQRPPFSAFAQFSGSFAQWTHQAIDAKPT